MSKMIVKCPNCGEDVPVEAPYTGKPDAVIEAALPKEYKHIGAWGYFGLTLLFSLPVVGFICLLVFSLGGVQNRNIRSFARSYFCGLLVAVIIFVIVLVLGISTGMLEYYADQFTAALDQLQTLAV